MLIKSASFIGLNDFDIEMFENIYKHSLYEYDIDLSEYEWN